MTERLRFNIRDTSLDHMDLQKRAEAKELRAVFAATAKAVVDSHAELCERVVRQVLAHGVEPERLSWHVTQHDAWERFLVMGGVRIVHIHAEWDGANIEFVADPMGPDHPRHLPAKESDDE